MQGNHRSVRPFLERMEERQLLSGVIAALARHPAHANLSAEVSGGSGSGSGGNGGSGATPNNEFLNPTGIPTPHEMIRQNLVVKAYGTFTVGPGRTSTEDRMIFIKLRDGFSPYSLHVFGQVGIVTLKDPTGPTSGEMTVFDKNINSNTVIGLDLLGSPGDVDRFGRPNRFTFTTDFNVSSGIFVESLSQGTVNIRYLPDGNAVVVVRGSVYTLGTSNVLHNQLIQRGGIPHIP